MANQHHLAILKQGVDVWNEWRKKHSDVRPDLNAADLFEASLNEADLSRTNLREARLNKAHLNRAILTKSNLQQADIAGAKLIGATLNESQLTAALLNGADLHGANLTHAILSGAQLLKANLSRTDLTHAELVATNLTEAHFDRTRLVETDLSDAIVSSTIFRAIDLSSAKGLDALRSIGRSTIDIDTIYLSQGNIPERFLQGAGIPDSFIEYMRSLIGKPIDYFSCFISYYSKDDAFAKRLYVDLQSEGVRCWFAPEDMKIGERIRDRIDESIRLYDKLLLILSEHSMMSEWVEDEVEAALEKERRAKEQGEAQTVLFPVRLDDVVKTTAKAWAAKLRRQRHIGDFTKWKNHDEYQKSFARLLRDLKAETSKQPT